MVMITTKTLKEKIPICKNTIKICQKKNYSPIYLRTEKILNTQKENMNKLKTKYENSLTNYTLKNYCNTDIKPNKKRHKKTSSYDYNNKLRLKTWLDQQDQWNRMVKKKNIDRINSLKTLENENEKKTLHPYLSQGTIKIFEDKEKNMENNLTNDTDGDFYYRNVNNGYEKLYTDMYEIDKKKIILYQKSLPTFTPKINPYKKNVQSKYFNEKNYISKNFVNFVNKPINSKKKSHKKSNSLDYNLRKSNDSDDFNYNYDDECNNRERDSESIQRWTHALLNIKNNYEQNENIYHLNIMPTCPWNENALNEIKMCGHARDIVKKFL